MSHREAMPNGRTDFQISRDKANSKRSHGRKMKLSTNQRARLPAASFAGPGRSFPVNDENHARLAIAMAPKSEHAGNITPEQAQAIQAKARAKLKLLKALSR